MLLQFSQEKNGGRRVSGATLEREGSQGELLASLILDHVMLHAETCERKHSTFLVILKTLEASHHIEINKI